MTPVAEDVALRVGAGWTGRTASGGVTSRAVTRELVETCVLPLARDRAARTVIMLLEGLRDRLATSYAFGGLDAGLIGAVNAQSLAPTGYSPALSARLGVVIASNLGVWAAAQAWAEPRLLREWITVGRCARSGHTEADGQQCALTQPYMVKGERLIVPGASDPETSWIAVDRLCRCAERFVPTPPRSGCVCGLPPPHRRRCVTVPSRAVEE